ncbi:hypothetical protein MRX96_006651 [Rhipicephalus microplus]
MMCRKQVTLMLIVAVTARALPIADPKTDHITPINTDLGHSAGDQSFRRKDAHHIGKNTVHVHHRKGSRRGC